MQHACARPAISECGVSQSKCVNFAWFEVPAAYSISSVIVSPLTAETRAIQEERGSPLIGRGVSGSRFKLHLLADVNASQK